MYVAARNEYPTRVTSKQFAWGLTAAWLGLSLSAPALFLYESGSRNLLIGYSVLWLALAIMTFGAWVSPAAAYIAQRALVRVWQQRWLYCALAAIWVGAYAWILWHIRDLFQEPGREPFLAFVGLAIFTALGLIVWLAPDLIIVPHRFTRTQRRILAFGGLIVLLGLGFYLWGENLHANWWIVDDHLIVNLIGQGHYLPWAELPQRAQMAGHITYIFPFQGPRFQPMFWLFWAFEAALWGDQPFLWYFFIISIFILATVVTWQLLKPALGVVNSLLFTIYLTTFSFWIDIFTRLGAAEVYALFGLTWYALAFVRLSRHYRGELAMSRWNVRGYWALLAVAGIISIGSKENFVFLILPSAAFLVYLVWKGQLPVAGGHALGATILWGLLSLASVLYVNTTLGRDEYGTSTAVEDRLSSIAVGFAHLFLTPPQIIAYGLLLILLIAAMIYLYRQRAKLALLKLSRNAVLCALLIAGLLLIVFSQLYMYDGRLPLNNRYDFPGVLAAPLVWLLGMLLFVTIVRVTLRRRFFVTLTTVLFATFLLGAIALTGCSAAQTASQTNVERTRAFADGLNEIQTTLTANPNVPLVLDTHSGLDEEPSQSVVEFLRRDGVTNPIFLRYQSTDPAEFNDALAQILAKRMSQVAQGALPSSYYQAYVHFPGGACYSVSFSDANTAPCQFITRIWR